MPDIRVLLAAKPMLNSLLRETLAPHEDIVVVADVPAHRGGFEEEELAARAAELGAQLVVLDELNSDAETLDGLLERRPRLKILALVDDGRDGALCELRPERTPLGGVWPTRLVEAIREAAEARTWAEEWA